MFIQVSLMLLQHSVSIIYSIVQNSSTLWSFPFVFAREDHQSRGQGKVIACHRQDPQSSTPRTKLVRNPKIASLGWKMEKSWDLFGWATQDFTCHCRAWKQGKRRKVRNIPSPVIHFPVQGSQTRASAGLVRERSPWQAEHSSRPFYGAAMRFSTCKRHSKPGAFQVSLKFQSLKQKGKGI